MSEYDKMKFFEQFEGEVSESDFTPEELSRYLAARGGRAGAENGAGVRRGGGADGHGAIAAWKRAYFEKYDDIKDKSLKKQDW